jgi:hypothetical protein
MLCATTQQEDQEQNRKGNSDKPKKNVARGTCLFNSFRQFHRDQFGLLLLVCPRSCARLYLRHFTIYGAATW